MFVLILVSVVLGLIAVAIAVVMLAAPRKGKEEPSCVGSGAPCVKSEDCCSSLVCGNEGKCAKACGTLEEPCGSDDCCEAGLVCETGMCRTLALSPPPCGAEGEECGGAARDCCASGLECENEYCQVPCGAEGAQEEILTYT